MLQGIADVLKLSLTDVQRFAKGKPMGPKWVSKIQNQLSRTARCPKAKDVVRPTGKGERGKSAHSELAKRTMRQVRSGPEEERGGGKTVTLHEASVAPKSDPRQALKGQTAEGQHPPEAPAREASVAEKGLSLQLARRQDRHPTGRSISTRVGRRAGKEPPGAATDRRRARQAGRTAPAHAARRCWRRRVA